MGDTLGVVRGFGGKLGRPDDKNTGPWAGKDEGWRGFVWDGTDPADPRYHFLRPAAAPDALISQQTGAVAGCDATPGSPRLDQQFYLKPDGQTAQGWAEQWQFYDNNANGAIMAVIEYGPGYGGEAGAFFAYALAFEALR